MSETFHHKALNAFTCGLTAHRETVRTFQRTPDAWTYAHIYLRKKHFLKIGGNKNQQSCDNELLKSFRAVTCSMIVSSRYLHTNSSDSAQFIIGLLTAEQSCTFCHTAPPTSPSAGQYIHPSIHPSDSWGLQCGSGRVRRSVKYYPSHRSR